MGEVKFGRTIDCKTVRIFVYSRTLCARTFKQKLKTESETGGRRFVRVRLSSSPILRKNQLFCSLVKQTNHCSEFPNAHLPYDQLQKQPSSNKTYLYISLMFLVICREILGSGRVGYRTNCPFEFSPTFVQSLYLKQKYTFSYSVVPG